MLPQGSPSYPGENHHARTGGLHLPPYAVNVFYPLVDLAAENGPTEFAPGSHMWGEVEQEEVGCQQPT